MTLDTVQSSAVALLTAAKTSGVLNSRLPVLTETSGSPFASQLETALLKEGLALVVLLPSLARASEARPGNSVLHATLDLLLVENDVANHTVTDPVENGGLNVNPLTIATQVFTALCGRPRGPSQVKFEMSANPLDRVSEVGATLIYALQVETEILWVNR